MQEERDPNIYAFMMQLVQEKRGEDIDQDNLSRESGLLYDIFGDSLLSHFEPQLQEDQKTQFDELVETNQDQDILMNFLIENIPDIEQQIIGLFVSFRQRYIEGEFEQG